MIELSTEDRERIEQQTKYYSNYHESNAFIEGAEYATRYEREQQAELKAEYHALCERTREPLAREEDLHKYRNALQTCHDREKKLEAERSEVIRRIKSILKASTVHDKISILEELEQLLNSLKK